MGGKVLNFGRMHMEKGIRSGEGAQRGNLKVLTGLEEGVEG